MMFAILGKISMILTFGGVARCHNTRIGIETDTINSIGNKGHRRSHLDGVIEEMSECKSGPADKRNPLGVGTNVHKSEFLDCCDENMIEIV